MTRHLMVAATAGAVLAVATFVVVTFGVDAYFRAMGWRETRRSSKESA
jgi:hypothetical protein